MTAMLLLIAIPAFGAAVGFFMRRKSQALKLHVLFAALITLSLGGIEWATGILPEDFATFPLVALLPLAAFFTMLGQPAQDKTWAPGLLTLLLLASGLGVLVFVPPLSLFFFFLVLGVVGVVLFQARHRAGIDVRWGIGTLALGLTGAAIGAVAVPPVSSIGVAVACACALPLVPLHKSYVAALSAPSGNLPAFLAVLLPVCGYHGLVTMLPELPESVRVGATILALVGMIYGSLKTFAQSRAASVVAYGGVAFFAILWWYLAAARTAPSQTLVFLTGVALASSGLHLAWSMLRSRFGDIALRGITDLARPMPRFAIALSLLMIAALGLPPFAVYSGFLGMLLAPSFTWSGYVMIILFAWLAASWYLFGLAQGLLFSSPRPEHRPPDLRLSELASLTIVLTLLIAFGLMPHDFLGTDANPEYRTAENPHAWTK
jgi:NADH-quinone oxidoreductase subunit M